MVRKARADDEEGCVGQDRVLVAANILWQWRAPGDDKLAGMMAYTMRLRGKSCGTLRSTLGDQEGPAVDEDQLSSGEGVDKRKRAKFAPRSSRTSTRLPLREMVEAKI